ncbi:MAG: glycosyltransferase, partial [Candidatus Portnoybacteria bacterium]
MNPKVFIIILNWKNWPDVEECLESIKNNDYPNYQVVIVDNDSNQKPEVSDSNIKVIYNDRNLGFSGGNNVGIKYALKNGADYILLLNDDTIVEKSFLTKLVEAGESDE